MKFRLTLAALALLLGSPAVAQTPAPASSADGLWLNPHASVAVKIGQCSTKLCGWIVWASAEAQSDAKDGGVTHLVGTELLENYQADAPGAWSGTVFVPDMGRRFYSRIKQLSPTQLKVSGCILGGFVCRSQVWTRIAHVPGN